jgi:hypothetical protein
MAERGVLKGDLKVLVLRELETSFDALVESSL